MVEAALSRLSTPLHGVRTPAQGSRAGEAGKRPLAGLLAVFDPSGHQTPGTRFPPPLGPLQNLETYILR